MTDVLGHMDLHLPRELVYDQWTQFEEFPRFMPHVAEAEQLDATHIRWRMTIAGGQQDFTAQIDEQIPDQLIAWRSTEGYPLSCTVEFDDINDTATHVTVTMTHDTGQEYDEHWIKRAELHLRQDLEGFRTFLEAQGAPNGAWRGEVHEGHLSSSSTGDAPLTAAA